MEANGAIPAGYRTVGEAAARLGVSVRTLQYYDKIGLLSPSNTSEGGRRLYSDKDIVKLHQIISLRHLGFSLDDIKNRLIPLDTPEEVARVLSDQMDAVREKLVQLSFSLEALAALRGEVMQMQTVDFGKYADIIVNLQMKNEFYWMIKHFDDTTMAHVRNRFDAQSAAAFIRRFRVLQDEAVRLYRAGENPAGEAGLAFAADYWQMIEDFTGGDMRILSTLTRLGHAQDGDAAWRKTQAEASAFLEPALGAWFARRGISPFAEVEHDERD